MSKLLFTNNIFCDMNYDSNMTIEKICLALHEGIDKHDGNDRHHGDRVFDDLGVQHRRCDRAAVLHGGGQVGGTVQVL